MKIRWIGEPRGLADPQLEVAKGDVVDLPLADARSFIEQGLAKPAASTGGPKKSRAKKAAATPPVSAETGESKEDA